MPKKLKITFFKDIIGHYYDLGNWTIRYLDA